eukprot:6485891-Amphidinium_carterae.2
MMTTYNTITEPTCHGATKVGAEALYEQWRNRKGYTAEAAESHDIISQHESEYSAQCTVQESLYGILRLSIPLRRSRLRDSQAQTV